MMDFDDFTRATYADVLRTVTLALGDVELAEDATQEAYAKAGVRWDHVALMDRPAGWVCVVAITVGRRAVRKQGRRVPTADQVSSVRDHAEGVADRLRFAEQLRLLPPRQRVAVVLRYLGDLSITDTARALGVSEGTVKASTHAALATLRRSLTQEVEHGHR
jgi:RNA polymerase sigma-70 factor (ECF subfamily)